MPSPTLGEVYDDVKNATSEKAVSDRVDRFKAELEQEAKRYGWPALKIAAQRAKLRVMIRTAANQEKVRAVRLNFQTALDRLAE
jgi:hypothetical protein